ncbi:MAG TPA: hypothetical protein VLC09_02470 [Polyangiaceae bacterium]|nr:hypothetical protein [Polyangiaceae bacterium]
MTLAIDVDRLAPPAQRVLKPETPLPMKMLAAKGVVPGCPPGDALAVLVVLAASGPAEARVQAQSTLDALPKPLLDGALATELQAGVLAALAPIVGNELDVLPLMLRMPSMTEDILCGLADRATEPAGELIATNEALVLRFSAVVERLYMNKRVRMSTADRLIELAARNGLDLDFPAYKLAVQAIANELIPEATDERTFDDDLFVTTEEMDEALQLDPVVEDVVDADDEGEEQIKEKFKPLYLQIQEMTISQKIRLATLGDSSARMLLVRDNNRLVSEAAVKSPRMTESEATQISASRAVSEDVLRNVAINRDLTRSYQVKMNLVTNPRTPFTFSSRFLPHLRDNDLRNLTRSKNVPGAIVRAARQQLSRKG